MPRTASYGCAILLLLALFSMPYGYYTLIRITTTAAFAYLAFCALQQGRTEALWPFAFVAVLFNPLIPIHLSKSIWVFADVVAAVALIVTARNKKEA